MAFDWNKWLPMIVGAGASVGGAALTSRAQGQQNENLQQRTEMNDKLAAEEMARRNYYSSILTPSLLQALGNRNPQVNQSALAMQQNAIPRMAAATGAPAPAPPTGAATIPSTPASGGAKALGIGAGGLGIASALGLSSFAGPAAPLVALGAFAANKVGQGRRTANQFVDAVENPFGQQLAQVSTEAKTDPDKARTDFQAAYQNYQNQEKGWEAQGGNQAKVARQSLSNEQLLQTIAALRKELGIA